MQKFRIFVHGTGELDGMYNEVAATSPAVAVKKVLDGGFQKGYTFASVDYKKRAKLALGKQITVTITRWE